MKLSDSKLVCCKTFSCASQKNIIIECLLQLVSSFLLQVSQSYQSSSHSPWSQTAMATAKCKKFDILFTVWIKWRFSENTSYLLCSCWLSTEDGTIWAFIGPAIAIIAVCFENMRNKKDQKTKHNLISNITVLFNAIKCFFSFLFEIRGLMLFLPVKFVRKIRKKLRKFPFYSIGTMRDKRITQSSANLS